MRITHAISLAVLLVARPLQSQGKITLPVSLQELEKRVVADSNDAAAHYNVALAYWNAKQWDKADQELRTSIRLEPRFAAPHLALAYILIAKNYKEFRDVSHIDNSSPKELRDAIRQRSVEFQRAFMIDPLVDMKIVAAATEALNLSDPAMDDVLGPTMRAYFQGFTDCEEGRYSDCRQNLGLVIRAFGLSKKTQTGIPTNVLWYHGLAAAHVKEYAEAIDDFSKLANRDSLAQVKAEAKDVVRVPIRSPQYRYFIGDFQQFAGNDDDAITSYHTALEKDLSLFMAHVHLADIYQKRKDYEHAIAERRNAVNANPDDPSLQVDLGVTLGLAGKMDEALGVLKSATEAMPRNPDAWYWNGIANESLGHKDDAKRAFERVVAVAPSRMQPRVDQAKAHLAKLGQ